MSITILRDDVIGPKREKTLVFVKKKHLKKQ